MKPKKEHKEQKKIIPFPASQPTTQTFFNNNGHGIVIYIHNSICHRVMQVKYEVPFEEACLIEIQLNKGDKLVFGCFYRSPTQSQRSTENCKSLNSLINSLAGNNNYTQKCFVGDFNFKEFE